MKDGIDASNPPARKRPVAGRRGHGEDCIYLDISTGRWAAVVSLGRKPDGRRHRSKVTAKTKAQVLAKLRDLHRRLDNGLPSDTRMTVGAWLDTWAAGLDARVRPNTADQYRFTIRKHLRPRLGTKALAKLTPADLDALWASKLAEGFKTNTVRLMRATLRRALHDAERDGLVVRNVAALSTPPRVEAPAGRTLTVEQARAFLAAANGDRLEAAYVLALALGPRRGELRVVRPRLGGRHPARAPSGDRSQAAAVRRAGPEMACQCSS
jgi:hypothetical protein